MSLDLNLNYATYEALIDASGTENTTACRNWIAEQELAGKIVQVNGGKVDNSKLLVTFFTYTPKPRLPAPSLATKSVAPLASSPISLPQSQVTPASSSSATSSSDQTVLLFDTYEALIDTIGSDQSAVCKKWIAEQQSAGKTVQVSGKPVDNSKLLATCFIHTPKSQSSVSLPTATAALQGIGSSEMYRSILNRPAPPPSQILSALTQKKVESAPRTMPPLDPSASRITNSSSDQTVLLFVTYEDLIDTIGSDQSAVCKKWIAEQQSAGKTVQVSGKPVDNSKLLATCFTHTPKSQSSVSLPTATAALQGIGSSEIYRSVLNKSALPLSQILSIPTQKKVESAPTTTPPLDPSAPRINYSSYKELMEKSGCDRAPYCYLWAGQQEKEKGMPIFIDGEKLQYHKIDEIYRLEEQNRSAVSKARSFESSQSVPQTSATLKAEPTIASFASERNAPTQGIFQPMSVAPAIQRPIPAPPQSAHLIDFAASAEQAKAIFRSNTYKKGIVTFTVEAENGIRKSFDVLLIRDPSCEPGVTKMRNGIPEASFSIIAKLDNTPEGLLNKIASLIPNSDDGVFISHGGAKLNGRTIFDLNWQLEHNLVP